MSIPAVKTIPTVEPPPDPLPVDSVRSIPTVFRAPTTIRSRTVKVPGTSKTITVPGSVSELKTSVTELKTQIDPILKNLPSTIPTNPVELYKTSSTIYKQAKSTIDPIVAPLIAPLFVDDPESRQRNFTRIHQICTLLDAKYKIPIIGITVGLDPLISAVPIVGDIVSTALSSYIVYLTRRFKVPWHVTARMVINVALNASIGSIPWLGSVFDVCYKPNLRNLQLLEQHLRTEAITKFKRDPAEVDAALAKAREGIEIDDDALTEGKGKGKAASAAFSTPNEDVHLPGGFYPEVKAGSSSGTAAKAEGYSAHGAHSEKLYPDIGKY